MLETVWNARESCRIVNMLPCPWFNEAVKKRNEKKVEGYKMFEFLKFHCGNWKQVSASQFTEIINEFLPVCRREGKIHYEKCI